MANDRRYYDMYNSGRDRRRYDPDSDFWYTSDERRENYNNPYRNRDRWYDDDNSYRNRERNFSGYNPVDRNDDFYNRNYYNNRYNDYDYNNRFGRNNDYYEGRDRYSERYNEDYRYNDYNNRFRREQDRDWWDRTSDEISSWFGDDEAARRRRMDKIKQSSHRGRGPKNYQRSDDRIRDDINDRLSDDHYLDASEINVQVSECDVTLTGTVNDRTDKRRAEDIAESVLGVKNVQNQLRVQQTVTTNVNNGLKTRTSQLS